MSSATNSWIPSVPDGWFQEDVQPSRRDVLVGLEAMRLGKLPVEVSSYNVEVFDMSVDADRKRYCEIMSDLLKKVQASQCVVWKNELQVLQTASGTGWHRYLEWSEYSVSDKAAADAEAADMAGDLVDSTEGVL